MCALDSALQVLAGGPRSSSELPNVPLITRLLGDVRFLDTHQQEGTLAVPLAWYVAICSCLEA